jgi:choline transport protein
MNLHEHGEPIYRGPAVELSHRPQKSNDVVTDRQLDDDGKDEVDHFTHSTVKDIADMHRMGKPQQLIRRFRQITMAAFIGVAVSAWEYALFLVSPGLVDGGRAGLLYNVLWSTFGFGAIYFSLAEMASMAPIAGSLYHWVSEFAPENVQEILSYFTG